MPQIGTQKYNIIVAQAETGEGGEGQHTVGEAHAGTETHAGAEHEGGGNPLAENPPLYYSGVALFVCLAIIAAAAFLKRRGVTARRPQRSQLLLEQGVESIAWFSRNAIGPGGEKFAPLIGTVFLFILCSNLMGVLPFYLRKTHEGVASLTPAPTSNLSITLAVALVVFVVVQYVGIKENGIGGHLKHFAGPIPWLAPLIFPLEIIGAIAKPISLSIRLFGNVFGEETVIAVLIGLAVSVLGPYASAFLPFHFPMLIFGVFGSIVQAGVFTILTCAYISLSLGDHDDHGHGAEHHDIKDEFGASVPAAAH